MPKTTTSLRLDDELRQKLQRLANQEEMSVSSLIERFVREGFLMEEFPGIAFNPGPTGRRAFVLGAADVWEIISDLRRFEGTEDDRVAALAEELGWHKHKIVIALNYAAAHPEEIWARIEANDRMYEEYLAQTEARKRLLA